METRSSSVRNFRPLPTTPPPGDDHAPLPAATLGRHHLTFTAFGVRRNLAAPGFADAARRTTTMQSLLWHLGIGANGAKRLGEARGAPLDTLHALFESEHAPLLLLCTDATNDRVGFCPTGHDAEFSANRLLKLATALREAGVDKRLVLALMNAARRVCRSACDFRQLESAIRKYRCTKVLPQPALKLSDLHQLHAAAPSRRLAPTAAQTERLLLALRQALAQGNHALVARIEAIAARLEADGARRPCVLLNFWSAQSLPRRTVVVTRAPLAQQVRNIIRTHDEALYGPQRRMERADAWLKKGGLAFDIDTADDSGPVFRLADGGAYRPARHAKLLLGYLDAVAGNEACPPHLSFGIATVLRGLPKPRGFDFATFADIYARAGIGVDDLSVSEAVAFAQNVCIDACQHIVATCNDTIAALSDDADPWRQACARALHRWLSRRLGAFIGRFPSGLTLRRPSGESPLPDSEDEIAIPHGVVVAMVQYANRAVCERLAQVSQFLAKLGHAPALAEWRGLPAELVGGLSPVGGDLALLTLLVADEPFKQALDTGLTVAIRSQHDTQALLDMYEDAGILRLALWKIAGHVLPLVLSTRLLIHRVAVATQCMVRMMEIHVRALDLLFEPGTTAFVVRGALNKWLDQDSLQALCELEDHGSSALEEAKANLAVMQTQDGDDPQRNATRLALSEELMRWIRNYNDWMLT